MILWTLADCLEEYMDYYGNDISQSEQGTVDLCQRSCDRNDKCRYFTFHTDTKKCFLKHSRNGRRQVALKTKVSGAKACHAKSRYRG